VVPSEYELTNPLYVQDADDGFGGLNNLGHFYAGHYDESIYLGLRHATLEEAPRNGILIYVNSPRISGGWSDPAFGSDQGEPGDAGVLDHAESLLTRSVINSTWLLPGTEFADLGFGLIDLGGDETQAGFPSQRDNVGLYRFAAPNSGDNLGYVDAEIAWADRGPDGGVSGEGGLEIRIDFADLGGLQLDDVLELVAFIANNTGFTSDETLPADLHDSGNPGVNPVDFNESPMKLLVVGP